MIGVETQSTAYINKGSGYTWSDFEVGLIILVVFSVDASWLPWRHIDLKDSDILGGLEYFSWGETNGLTIWDQIPIGAGQGNYIV